MWTDQNRVYAAFMGVIDGYLEVDGGWEQDLIKDCGKRIAESKRLHIWCPTKCVCVIAQKCKGSVPYQTTEVLLDILKKTQPSQDYSGTHTRSYYAGLPI